MYYYSFLDVKFDIDIYGKFINEGVKINSYTIWRLLQIDCEYPTLQVN